LVGVGDGRSRPALDTLASTRPYVHVLGARFDADKVRALAPAALLLVPGLVGLTIVDAFALELPLVTTAIDYHSPEIEYLVPEENGVLVEHADDPSAYARAVVGLLGDPDRLARLREGCSRAARRYTIQAMVARVADGVAAALEAP